MKNIYLFAFVAFLFTAEFTFAQCLSDDLVVDMHMDSSFADSSIFDQPIYVFESPAFTMDRNGNANGALVTSNGSLFLNNAQSGEFKAPFPFTFSAWVKPYQLNARNPIFMNEDHGTSYSGAWVNITQDGKITANVGNGGLAAPASRTNYTTDSAAISPGEWYNITVVFDSLQDIRIYLNGAELATTASISGGALYYFGISGTAGKIGSGVNGSGSNANFDGAIDDVRFWITSLQEEQIQAIYSSHKDIIAGDSMIVCESQSSNAIIFTQYCAYKWSNGSTASVTSVSGSDLGVGNHVVYVSAYDNENIEYTDSILVTVTVCTGINDKDGVAALSLYPNPTTDATTITFENIENEPFTIKLFDLTGKLILNKDNLVGNQYLIQLGELDEGIYHIELITPSNSYSSKLVVK